MFKEVDSIRANCTSFHGDTVIASINELIEVLGEPAAIGSPDEKVQIEWVLENEKGFVFTVYDWKEYRQFHDNEYIEWNIGTHYPIDSNTAKVELTNAIHKLKKGGDLG